MIDEQFKDYIERKEKELLDQLEGFDKIAADSLQVLMQDYNPKLISIILIYKDRCLRNCLEEGEKLKKRNELLEKLVELNMKDFHEVVEQRDWYYERYSHYKKINNS